MVITDAEFWAQIISTYVLLLQSMMKKARYSDLAKHQKIHSDFLIKVKKLNAPIDYASITWAKKW